VQVHYVQQWYKAGDRFTIRANSESKKIEYALNGRVMYTSLKTVIFPFTAGVSMQTAGSSVQDVTWEGQYDCSTATAAFCASKNRLSCFNNNECGDCLHGFDASSSNANSMCNLSPAEAKSTVQWELFRGVTFPDSSSIAAKSWTTWGTSGAISTHAIGDCSAASGVSLTSAFVDKQLMFGLAFNPTPEGYAHYNNIQYAFYLRSDGGLHVYENGL
jgi:hypothetical protein